MKAQIKPNCSFSWRSLCGSRVVINKGAKWIIGNGRLVSIWGDPWIPLPSSFMVFTPKPAYTSLHSVADLIDSLSRACKIDTIAALFSSIEVNLIRSIPLSIRDAKDELTWHYEAKGTFSIKIAYHVARIWLTPVAQRGSSSSNENSFSNLLSIIWKENIPPKVHMTFLETLQQYCAFKGKRCHQTYYDGSNVRTMSLSQGVGIPYSWGLSLCSLRMVIVTYWPSTPP